MEDDGIKWCRMGTGYLVEPTPDNLVVPLLAHYGVSPSRIVGYEYKGVEFQDLDANKYKDYTVAFFGIPPDEELPTRFIFGREGEKTLDVWHIIIYWGDVYDACIKASWSTAQSDFIVTMQLGRLDTLNLKVTKRLADGLALLLWVQEQLTKDGRGGPHNVKIANQPKYIREALGVRYVELLSELATVKQDAKTFSRSEGDK